MKRRHFRAVVTADAGNTIIGERDTFAWNSAIRASEAIVRDYAREGLGAHYGAAPQVMTDPERIYRRVWTGPTGRELTALVWEVVATA